MTDPQNLQDEDHQGSAIRWSTWTRLFQFARRYPKKLVLVATFALLVGVADIAFPLVSKFLIDAITLWQAEGGPRPSLVPYVLTYVGLTGLLCTSVWAFIRVVGSLKANISCDIRREGFANLQRLEFSYYDHRATGWLMSRMTSDCERLANIMAWGTLDVLWATSLCLGIAGVLLFLQWKLALLVLTVVPLLYFTSRYFQKRLLEASRRIRKINSGITADFNESIMGVLTTKIFGQQAPASERFAARTEEMYQASVRNAVLSALYLPTILTIGSLATAMVLVRGGILVNEQLLTLGTLVAFLSYAKLMFEPLEQLASIFGDLQMAQASGERVVELLEQEPQIVDSPAVHARIQEQLRTPGPDLAEDGFPDRVGVIEYRDVSFSYNPDGDQAGDARILAEINLRIQPGQTVALVGSTGGGKTTLMSLLCRFYEPTQGQINIDDIDIQDRSLKWLQSNFGVVLQDPHLFRGSVMENIRYGQLDATEDQILEASKLVGAHDLIERLPGSYEFDVGEGGGQLSQGMRQLISFARALLKDPAVLIMDEATSNVDSETEAHIQVGLKRVLKGRTSLVIAHRLSTIESADQIVVIEHGRIVEQGTHRELLALGKRYHQLQHTVGAASPGS